MRLRGLLAVGAGLAGAALAHALDEAGLLPGVHETASVRAGMSPLVTVLWLGLAASLAWLAAQRGPIRIGAPASLVIAAVPELVGRHDLGAVVEPGAIAGALLQWLLLLAVVVAIVAANRSTFVLLEPTFALPVWQRTPDSCPRARSQDIDHRGRPRAPPRLHLSVTVA